MPKDRADDERAIVAHAAGALARRDQPDYICPMIIIESAMPPIVNTVPPASASKRRLVDRNRA